jgi:RNA polymerase sigma factor (sigma-70 family)
VWLKAHREIRSLNSPEALRTWLFRMASRACIDYSRSRACRERGSPEISEEMLESPAGEPESVIERRGELRVMWETLAAMPPRQSLALYLKQVEGCSYDEIGRVLACPKTAVETLLFRARQGFARTHQQLEEDPDSSCKLIGQSMAVVLDHEATQFQERAVQAHVNECRPCRVQMQTMGRGIAGYAWLPMLPIGQQALFAALAAGTGGAGAGIGIGRIICGLLIKAKAASTVAVVVGAVGTTAVAAGAATGVTPTPGDVVSLVRESVGAGPETVADDGRDAPGDDEDASAGPGGRGDKPGTSTAGGLPPAGPLGPGSGPTGGLDDPVGGLNGTLGGLTGTVDTTLDGVVGVVEGVLDGVTGLIDDPLGTVTNLLNDPLGTASEVVDDVTDIVDDAVGGTTETTDQTVDDTTDVVDDLTGGATEDLTGGADDLTDDVTDVVDDVTGDVTETLDDILGPPEEDEEPPLCIPLPLLPC